MRVEITLGLRELVHCREHFGTVGKGGALLLCGGHLAIARESPSASPLLASDKAALEWPTPHPQKLPVEVEVVPATRVVPRLLVIPLQFFRPRIHITPTIHELNDRTEGSTRYTGLATS